jgi:hypothetical protein
MQNEWTEYKSYSYLVSPVANSPGQPRVWHDNRVNGVTT